MPVPPSAQGLEEALTALLKTPDGEERQQKMSELMDLLKRARARKANSESQEELDQDCPEGVDDCDEVKSPCCSAQVSTVFGTLPLKVECKECGEQYFMGKLLRDLSKR